MELPKKGLVVVGRQNYLHAPCCSYNIPFNPFSTRLHAHISVKSSSHHRFHAAITDHPAFNLFFE
jgi:hypothetical protein